MQVLVVRRGRLVLPTLDDGASLARFTEREDEDRLLHLPRDFLSGLYHVREAIPERRS